YHALMRRSIAMGLASSIWENGNQDGGMRHQARAARFYLTAELESGHLCPVTMTSASLGALMADTQLFGEWEPRLTARQYDSSQRAPAGRSGLTIGMGMTERQGGTDIRTNSTRAEPLRNGLFRITGHK